MPGDSATADSTMDTNISYTIYDTTKTIFLSMYTQSPACGITATETINMQYNSYCSS